MKLKSKEDRKLKLKNLESNKKLKNSENKKLSNIDSIRKLRD